MSSNACGGRRTCTSHARSKDAPATPMALADAMSLLPFVIRTLLAHLVC